jgi:hypothetical protein
MKKCLDMPIGIIVPWVTAGSIFSVHPVLAYFLCLRDDSLAQQLYLIQGLDANG